MQGTKVFRKELRKLDGVCLAHGLLDHLICLFEHDLVRQCTSPIHVLTRLQEQSSKAFLKGRDASRGVRHDLDRIVRCRIQRVDQRLVRHWMSTGGHGRVLLAMFRPDRIDARSTIQSGAQRGGEVSVEVSTKGHGIALEEKIPNHHPALSVVAISHQVSSHPIHTHLQALGPSYVAPVVSVLALTVAVMKSQVTRVSVVKHQLDRKFLKNHAYP